MVPRHVNQIKEANTENSIVSIPFKIFKIDSIPFTSMAVFLHQDTTYILNTKCDTRKICMYIKYDKVHYNT